VLNQGDVMSIEEINSKIKHEEQQHNEAIIIVGKYIELSTLGITHYARCVMIKDYSLLLL
jgi:hypothetical protein